jgi:hypothetical protein
MGGFGSGQTGWRRKVEHFRSLDINALHRAGLLVPGKSGGLQWTRDGYRDARIHCAMELNALRLMYRFRDGGSEWEDVDYRVPIVQLACHFGGSRPYFICPNTLCGRRVAKLHGAESHFMCRKCQRLAYASQCEAAAERHQRRANKLRRCLGGKAGSGSTLAAKPKGMHERTYRQKVEAIYEAEDQAEQAFIEDVGQRFPGILNRL